MIAEIEDGHHRPSDAMHNPPKPLRISQKIYVSFLTKITRISINFLTPKHQSDTEVFTMTMEILLELTSNKLSVTLLLLTAYHPQTSRQVKVTNRGLKRILERTVGENHALWSDKLEDALWAFRIAFKTPIGCTPYILVYGKSCHLTLELEHKAFWALKHANFDLKIAGDHLKLKSRWSGPFTIAEDYPYGTSKLVHTDGSNIKVNCHRLKHYHGGDTPPLEILDFQTLPKDN
nr:hypothetical protein [Tanacetum cinerariifolium]